MADRNTSPETEKEAHPFSQSSPATEAAVKERAGARVKTDSEARRASGGAAPGSRRDGDPFDQSDKANDEAVSERATPGPSHLNDGER